MEQKLFVPMIHTAGESAEAIAKTTVYYEPQKPLPEQCGCRESYATTPGFSEHASYKTVAGIDRSACRYKPPGPLPERIPLEEHHIICEQHGETCGVAERLLGDSVELESSKEEPPGPLPEFPNATRGPWRMDGRSIEGQAFDGSWKYISEKVRGGSPAAADENTALIVAAVNAYNPEAQRAAVEIVEILMQPRGDWALGKLRDLAHAFRRASGLE